MIAAIKLRSLTVLVTKRRCHTFGFKNVPLKIRRRSRYEDLQAETISILALVNRACFLDRIMENEVRCGKGGWKSALQRTIYQDHSLGFSAGQVYMRVLQDIPVMISSRRRAKGAK